MRFQKGHETGEAIRGDTTTVETNIHYPTDASLLHDTVRVLTRLLVRLRTKLGKEKVCFTNHLRRSKAKLFTIHNSRCEQEKHEQYLELIRITRATVSSAMGICQSVGESTSRTVTELVAEIRKYTSLGNKVVDQAYRRMVKKEHVPASEKIVSIFEDHTNIIVKGFRDVVFGHKIMLTTGTSGLLLSMKVLDGTPKDSTLVKETIENHKTLFGEAPKIAAFDGAFASHENRASYPINTGLRPRELKSSHSVKTDL